MYNLMTGDRPVPSCLGGGDLDGDVYNLIPLDDLPNFWPKMLHDPATYDPAPRKTLETESTIDDIAEFVMDYIISDVSIATIFEDAFLHCYRIGRFWAW